MTRQYRRLRFFTIRLTAALTLLVAASVPVWAQVAADAMPHVNIYGFAMLDTGYETGQSNPSWFDVMRPSKSRLGFKGYIPTSAGRIKTIFEFDMFGTGVDAGQTTFRLRHAWGELGRFGAGQTWSPFMDIDVFPNSAEYWGPNPSSTLQPIVGKALPVSGVVAFCDLSWNEKWTSTVGYSRVDIDNTEGQAPSAFKSGQYALTNIFYYPVVGVMLGPEVQWGYRDNNQGFHVADYKFQFSARYNFDFKVGG